MPETPHSKYLAEVPKDAKDYPFIWLWHTKVLPAGGTEYIYGVIEQARRALKRVSERRYREKQAQAQAAETARLEGKTR